MVFHQPGHGLGVGRRHAQPRAQAAGDLGADIAVIARQALGHVVQQHGAIQHGARLDALDHFGGQRIVVLVFAALDGGDIADGADQMLVHRVMVIHVELHQPHGMAEFRNEAAQHARLIHQAQRPLRILARGQHRQEGGIGFGIGAQLVVDQVERAGDGAQRVGMDVHLLGVGDLEDAQDIDRVLAEDGGIGGQPAILDIEIIARWLRGLQEARQDAASATGAAFCAALPARRRKCASGRRHPWRSENRRA